MRSGHLVVDAHSHLMPYERQNHGGRDGRWTTEQQMERMDRFGLDVAVVIAHAWAGWVMDQYRQEHDLIAEEIAKHPYNPNNYLPLFRSGWEKRQPVA